MMDPYFQRTVCLHVLLFTIISLSTTTPLRKQANQGGYVRIPCPCAEKGNGIRWDFSRASLDPTGTSAGHVVESAGHIVESAIRVAELDGDGVIVYPQRETDSENKYKLTHWGREWGYLQVESLSLGDEGIYSCESSVEGNWSCDVSLTVNVPVSQAFITHHTANTDHFLDEDEVVLLKENQRAIFKCFTYGAKPHANITWYHSGLRLTTDVRTYFNPSHNQPGLYNTIGWLTVKRASILGYHLHTLTCRSVGAGPYVKRRIRIHIIAPLQQPSITGNPSLIVTSVSSPFELTCHVVDSFPPAALDWFIGSREAYPVKHSTNQKSSTGYTNRDENPTGHSTNQLQNVTNKSWSVVRRNINGKYDVTSRLVISVNHTHDGNAVNCVARHPGIDRGRVEESNQLYLDIKYPPRFISSNVARATRAHNHGDAIINITCIYEANPVAQIHWSVPSISPENLSHVEMCSGPSRTIGQLTLSTLHLLGGMQVNCYANNSIGNRPHTIEIEIENVDRTTQTLIQRSTENEIDARSTREVSSTRGKDQELVSTHETSHSLTERDQELLSTHDTSHSLTKRDVKTEDERPVDPRMGVERILLIVTSSTSVLFMIWILLLLMKRRWIRSKYGPHDRSALYVDMSSRRGMYQVQQRQENLPSPTESEVFTDEGDPRHPFRTNIAGRYFTQQSVENTYDIIPVGRASPPSFHPRRRRVQSEGGMFYDIPPPARGPDTVRRVQSRRLPQIPAFLVNPDGTTNQHSLVSRSSGQLHSAVSSQHDTVSYEGRGSDSTDTPYQEQVQGAILEDAPYQTQVHGAILEDAPYQTQVHGTIIEDAPYQTQGSVSPITPYPVLRTVSSDTGAPRIPELKGQYGGHSEKIIREHVALLKKVHSPVRRVFSLPLPMSKD